MPADHSGTPWRPRFDYGVGGDAQTWAAVLPCRYWTETPEKVGGRQLAMSGLGASYFVRNDMLVQVPVRFYEEDWPNLWNVIRYGQLELPFTWYPDANESTSYTVYLHHPDTGTRLLPTRDSEYPHVKEIVLTLRREDTSASFDLLYHPL